MDVVGRGAVVTGAARGIGAAIARALHRAGARVAVVDRAGSGVDRVAVDLNLDRPDSAFAIEADLSTREGNEGAIDAAERALGDVDVYVANAGVGLGTDLSSSEQDWERSFAVNLHAHRWAAARLVPTWLQRGEGYFVSTASAAGLLAHIGSVPYSVTKHAAVAFAEWLSITYGDRGITVSCLCPQGVNTSMLSPQYEDPAFAAATDVVLMAGELIEPDDVASAVMAGIAEGRFLILPHPQVQEFMMRRAANHEHWLKGMRAVRARVESRPRDQ